MIAVGTVYLGLITAFFAAVSMIKPLSFLGIHSRRHAALLLGIAVIVVVVGCFLPAREKRVEPPRTELDQFVPVYQFNEFHSIDIAASKDQVYRESANCCGRAAIPTLCQGGTGHQLVF